MTETREKEPAGSFAAREAEADKIVHGHIMWAIGAGLMPFPLFDIMAVTAVQMDMLKQLAEVYEVDYSKSGGKTFVGGLTGGTFAHIGASLFKFVPGIGSVLGGLSMSVMSGASTYAVASVARSYFLAGKSFSSVDFEEGKRRYEEEFARGKEVATDLESEMKGDKGKYRAAFEAVDKLRVLHEDGVLTDEEFDDMKRKLLEKL